MKAYNLILCSGNNWWMAG